jgi:hypothetical protein
MRFSSMERLCVAACNEVGAKTANKPDMTGQCLTCVLGTAEQYSGSQLVRENELVLLAASFDSLVWWPWLTIRGYGYEHSA